MSVYVIYCYFFMATVHSALVAVHLCSCFYFIDDDRDLTIDFYLLNNVKQR